ncbi:MAG: hypothetical protein MJZ48_02740 [Paludibacteraceae bacterium]|nr:hypothetical protein [Paludibacteraceae bacterium]
MAIIKPSTPFDSIRRKFAHSDDIHFKNRRADNATIAVRMKHPYDGGSSASQIANREKFAEVSATVKAILAATSTDTDQANYTLLTAYKAAFKNQKRYLYLRSYIFAQEYAKL